MNRYKLRIRTNIFVDVEAESASDAKEAVLHRYGPGTRVLKTILHDENVEEESWETRSAIAAGR